VVVVSEAAVKNKRNNLFTNCESNAFELGAVAFTSLTTEL